MEKKDCILIWTDSLENSLLIKHGMELALHLGTHYCILCLEPTSNSFTLVLPNSEIIQSSKKKAIDFVLDNKNELGILFVVTNVIFFNEKLSKESVRKIKAIKKTELACIFIKDNFSINTYKNIACVAGYEKGEKEKIMWANYLAKKMLGKINVMLPFEKDEFIGKNITNIELYSTKLFSKTNNLFEIHKCDENTEKLKRKSSFMFLNEDSLLIVNMLHLNMNIFKQAADILHIERSGQTACMIVPETDDALIPCH